MSNSTARPYTSENRGFAITLDGTYASANDTILSGSHLDFTKPNDNPILFSDVFAFTDYQLPKNTAGTYQLLRNSSKIDFNDPISDGDMLEITFIYNLGAQ